MPKKGKQRKFKHFQRKEQMKKTARLTVRVSEEEHARIKYNAIKKGETISQFIRNYIDRI